MLPPASQLMLAHAQGESGGELSLARSEPAERRPRQRWERTSRGLGSGAGRLEQTMHTHNALCSCRSSAHRSRSRCRRLQHPLMSKGRRRRRQCL